LRNVQLKRNKQNRRGFKALKQIVKLRQRLGQRDEMLAAYRRMLEYADGGWGGAGGAAGGGGGGGGAAGGGGGGGNAAVTRNAAEKKLNSLLDAVAAQAAAAQQHAAAAAARQEPPPGHQQQQASQQQHGEEAAAAAKAAAAGSDGGGGGAAAVAASASLPAEDPAAALLRAFYEQTVASLDRGRNERLWFKASMRLAHLALERADYPRAAALLRELHRACRLPGGGGGGTGGGGGGAGGGGIDPARGTQALEVYAAEIRMATEQRDNKRLKELYHQVRDGGADDDRGTRASALFPPLCFIFCFFAPPSLKQRRRRRRRRPVSSRFRPLPPRMFPPQIPSDEPTLPMPHNDDTPDSTPLEQNKTTPKQQNKNNNKKGAVGPVGHPPPARARRHPRVRRKDAHGRAPLARGALGLFRGVPVLRRGRERAAGGVPQVPGAGDDAHGVGRGPVRVAGALPFWCFFCALSPPSPERGKLLSLPLARAQQRRRRRPLSFSFLL